MSRMIRLHHRDRRRNVAQSSVDGGLARGHVAREKMLKWLRL